jgi:2-succinyl-6-hydroxy-2,4-cyclohexadiene-1-carboxylate synthase
MSDPMGAPMEESRVYRVPARGIEIEVEEAGRGDRPFVLLHGFTGSRDDFREQIPRLGALGRTVAIDQRGHGGSTNTGEPGDYRLDELVADLEAALTALAAPACDLLGHSMGGMVALRFALAHPERVRSLVLMDTIARPIRFLPPAVVEGGRAVIEARGMQGLFELARSPKIPRPEAFLRFARTFGEERFWERVRAKLVAMDPAAWLAFGSTHFDGVHDRLGEIRCPTLVMVGEQDTVFLAPADELAAGIPGARRLTIAGAAHSPQHENADAWFEAVRAHLLAVRG